MIAAKRLTAFALTWVLAGLLSLPTLVVAAGAAHEAASRPAGEGPSWSSLTAAQRSALAPLERDWPQIDAQRKAKWLEVASRFPALPPTEQKRVQERMTEWARLSPAERGRARLSFQESKQLTPEQKQAKWEAYQALPDEQRRALAQKSAHASSKPGLPAAGNVAASAKGSAASAPAKPKSIGATVVQSGPGATTTLVTAPPPKPPLAQHKPGQPKIAAQPGLVDPGTLLPQQGPQAAASAASQP